MTAPEITFEPPLLSSPPWKPVPGVFNFRDLGGYPIAGSTGSVKRNLIFRSAEPSHVTGAGMQMLVSSLAITDSYDLRSRPEIKNLESTRPVLDIPGITRNFVPVFEDQDLSPEALAKRYSFYTRADLTSAYRLILRAGGPGAYKVIFTHILTRPEAPLLVHCTAGKDRTGVLCALILKLAGVEDQVVAEEYALTSVGLEPYKEAIRKRLGTQPVFEEGGESARVGMENMLSSTVSTMLNTLAMIREELGGVEEYLERNCGFTKEEIQMIKRNVTSGEPPCLCLDKDGKIVAVE